MSKAKLVYSTTIMPRNIVNNYMVGEKMFDSTGKRAMKCTEVSVVRTGKIVSDQGTIILNKSKSFKSLKNHIDFYKQVVKSLN